MGAQLVAVRLLIGSRCPCLVNLDGLVVDSKQLLHSSLNVIAHFVEPVEDGFFGLDDLVLDLFETICYFLL